MVKPKDKHKRAEMCTKKLKEFDSAARRWADFGVLLTECEMDKLYEEVGCKTWDEWVKRHAPTSYRRCYEVKSLYKFWSARATMAEMRKWQHTETLKWAMRAKNISPSVLDKPEVREALLLPKRKAIEVLTELLPHEHIETVKNRLCKFAESQHTAIMVAYSAYKYLVDSGASFEDFVEQAVEGWYDSDAGEGQSFRERWHAALGQAAQAANA